jgi:hypothetical protein
MSMQKCPVCRERKPKRTCPALGQTICTVCCATKRQVEIACPQDCPYLSSARSHPPAVVQRRQERDLTFMLPLISDLTETQYRLTLLFQSIVVRHAEGAVPALVDVDIAEATAALAATLETAGKGIIYEHHAVSVPAQQLTAALRGTFAELVAQNTAQQGRIERESAVALRRIERGARTAAQALAGDDAPVYLGLLQRMLSNPGAAPAGSHPGDAADPGRGEAAPRLIIQP